MRFPTLTIVALAVLATACGGGSKPSETAAKPAEKPAATTPAPAEQAPAATTEAAAATPADGAAAPADAAAAATTTAVAAVDAAALAPKLALADAADGTVDKVVSKCTGCKLGMAGKAEHSTTVGEYTLHMCSPECQQKVAADPTAAINALTL